MSNSSEWYINKRVRVKNVDMSKWIDKNWKALEDELYSTSSKLLLENGGGVLEGYSVEISERKDRPIVNITAKERAGWREHAKGGPLTKIAAIRHRFKGALK